VPQGQLQEEATRMVLAMVLRSKREGSNTPPGRDSSLAWT
jgi:hypothetical protein